MQQMYSLDWRKNILDKYADKGYKQFLVDNYISIFKIDENEKTVFVITVLYQGRNL